MSDRDKLLNDIRGGVHLRPAVTVDKSKPIILAEGEKPVKLGVTPALSPSEPPCPPPVCPPAPPMMVCPPPPPPPLPATPKTVAPKLPPTFQAKMTKKPDRDALMDEIRSGRCLKHVETVDKSKPIFTDEDSMEPKAPSPTRLPTAGLMGELSAKLASRSVSVTAERSPERTNTNSYAEPKVGTPTNPSASVIERFAKVDSAPAIMGYTPPAPPPPPPPTFLPHGEENGLVSFQKSRFDNNNSNNAKPVGSMPRCSSNSIPTPLPIHVSTRENHFTPATLQHPVAKHEHHHPHQTDEKTQFRQFPSPTRSTTDIESASESGFASYEFEESSLSPQSESPPSASPERFGVSVPELQKQFRSRSTLAGTTAGSGSGTYSEDVKEIARSLVSDTLRKFEKGKRPNNFHRPLESTKAAMTSSYVETNHYAKKQPTPTTPKYGKVPTAEQRMDRFEAPKRSGSVSDIFRRAQEESRSPEPPAFRMPRRQGSIHDIVKKLESQSDHQAPANREQCPAPIKLRASGEVRKSVEKFGDTARRASTSRERPEHYDAWLRGTNGRVEERSRQFENVSQDLPRRSASHRPARKEEKIGSILRSNNPGETIRTWRAPPVNRDVLSRPGVDRVTEHIEAKAAAASVKMTADSSSVQTDDGRMMYGVDFLNNMTAKDLPKLYRMVICDDVNGPTISLRRKAVVD